MATSYQVCENKPYINVIKPCNDIKPYINIIKPRNNIIRLYNELNLINIIKPRNNIIRLYNDIKPYIKPMSGYIIPRVRK